MLHGILLIALFSCAAFYIGEAQIFKEISFSPMIIGIILGMLYANSLRNHLPETWVPGIQFCAKKILRLGIILYGFRLTFQDIIDVGVAGILIDVIIVFVTIIGGVYLGKLLKMDRDIALLTSIGSGICGAAAVLGAESTIQTKPYKTAVAVATVVIFGTISMFIYPIAYRSGFLGLTPDEMGIYAGATLHEVAHRRRRQCHGYRDLQCGNHCEDDTRDAARPCAFQSRILDSTTSTKGRQRICLQRQSRRPLVCAWIPCRHRIQLPEPIAPGSCRYHKLHRHIPPHNGNGSPRSRDKH